MLVKIIEEMGFWNDVFYLNSQNLAATIIIIRYVIFAFIALWLIKIW